MRRVLCLFCLLMGPLSADVTIGSKNFTEQLILGEIFAQLIEQHTDIPVHRKLNLAGSHICFEALRTGGIDLYPEYVGTGLVAVLNRPPESDSTKAYNEVQRSFNKAFSLVWGKPLGFSNTACLLVRGKDPLFAPHDRISDLKHVEDQIIFGSPYGFQERADGFPVLGRDYHITIPRDRCLGFEPGLMYQALKTEDVNVIGAFSTDPRNDVWELKMLEDDLHSFPAYDAAPLYSQVLAERHPEVISLLDRLQDKIDVNQMRHMNHQVDFLGISPENVAQEFLVAQALISGVVRPTAVSTVGAFAPYFWDKRGYVAELVMQHLALSLSVLFLASAVGIPLGFFLTRFPTSRGIVIGVVNIFQTIPSLALLGFLIPIIGIGFSAAIVALFFYALLPIVRNTYVGVWGINPNIIDASRGIGLTDLQILFYVELPLSLPMIIAGLRTSTMIVVGTATVAALIGAGGLGDPIFRGISSVNNNLILLGAIPAAALAIFLDLSFHYLEAGLISKGLRKPAHS